MQALRTSDNHQYSATGAGVSTPCGAVSNLGIPVFVPGCWTCRCSEGFLIRGWELIVRVRRNLHTARGATLLARLPHEPQPVSNRPMGGVGFPHRVERYRPWGSLFFVPRFSKLYMYGSFLIRRWEVIVPGRSEPRLVRGNILAAHWFYEP